MVFFACLIFPWFWSDYILCPKKILTVRKISKKCLNPVCPNVQHSLQLINRRCGLDSDLQNIHPAGLPLSTAENELLSWSRVIPFPRAVSQRGPSTTAVTHLSAELLNCFKCFFFFQCVLETPSSGHLESRWIYVQYPEALLAILYCRFQVCSVQLMLHDWTSNFSSKTFVWDPAIHYYARVDNSGQIPDSGVKPTQIGVPTMIQMNLVI